MVSNKISFYTTDQRQFISTDKLSAAQTCPDMQSNLGCTRLSLSTTKLSQWYNPTRRNSSSMIPMHALVYSSYPSFLLNVSHFWLAHSSWVDLLVLGREDAATANSFQRVFTIKCRPTQCHFKHCLMHSRAWRAWQIVNQYTEQSMRSEGSTASQWRNTFEWCGRQWWRFPYS